jgi:acetyl esterase/lipase
VLHLRGGAFLNLAPGTERPVAMLLAEAGAVVVSADYPAGIACPFPGAVEAMYSLLWRLHDRRAQWASRTAKLFVAGEEAGGNLAAALALMARDRLGPPLAGQILLSPMLDAGMATCSYRDAAAGPVGCKWADGWQAYLGTPDKAAHPYAAPSCGSRLHGLPPALVLTAQDDLMRDESLCYARRLQEAGTPVQAHILDAGGWPDALAGPRAPWAAKVRDVFSDFFATVLPALAPAPLTMRS